MIVRALIAMLIVSIAINIWMAIWIREEKEMSKMVSECYIRNIAYWRKMCMKREMKVSSQKDLMEAAKYAMTRAHPDNGGKKEDFIKYRDIYQRVKEAAG